MAYCGEYLLTTTGEQRKLAVTLRCRSWGCEGCAPDRKRKLVAEAASGHPTAFITLTSRRREGVFAADAARDLVQAWRQTRRVIMRERGWKTLDFFAVLERTQNGWPHLHILARCGWIDQKRLSALMLRFAGSPIVDIRAVKGTKHAARYIAKYMGKQDTKFATLKRYWHTKTYKARREARTDDDLKGSGEWSKLHCSIIEWAKNVYMQGWSVTFQGMTRATAERPP